MFMVFDFETTGVINEKWRWDDPRQPHIVQMAAFMFNDEGRRLHGASLIVDAGPDVKIPDYIARIHGITTERMRAEGVPVAYAMGLFRHMHKRCEEAVAYNARFDVGMLELELRRMKSMGPTETSQQLWARLGGAPFRCAMEPCVSLVNLPPTEHMKAWGHYTPKTPKLAETVKALFGETLDGAHDAGVDAAATARVWLDLRRRGLVARPASATQESAAPTEAQLVQQPLSIPRQPGVKQADGAPSP